MKSLVLANVVPVINENDALAASEFSFGDNDNLAALVAHLVGADKLLLLTDTDGLYDADPRTNPTAQLHQKVEAITSDMVAAASSAGSSVGRGGMASKLSAAQIATWSGVETIVANAEAGEVVRKATEGNFQVGTTFLPKPNSLSARKLWLGFGVASHGSLTVDDGAVKALSGGDKSLLAAGVSGASGNFMAGTVVEIYSQAGDMFAKGISKWSSKDLAVHMGAQSTEAPHLPDSVVHVDDLVVLPK